VIRVGTGVGLMAVAPVGQHAGRGEWRSVAASRHISPIVFDDVFDKDY